MWNLHVLAETYHQRPSAIAGVSDEWAAYQFDMAVLSFAQWVGEQIKRKRPLHEILKAPDEKRRSSPGTFASFTSLGPVRKMRIPESGVW